MKAARAAEAEEQIKQAVQNQDRTRSNSKLQVNYIGSDPRAVSRLQRVTTIKKKDGSLVEIEKAFSSSQETPAFRSLEKSDREDSLWHTSSLNLRK